METDFLSGGLSNFMKTEEFTNVDNILANVSNNSSSNALNFTDIVNEIMKKKMLLKLNKNVTYIVDGRIIHFSNLLKQLCCNCQNFNYRLNLELVDRELFIIILDFIEIINWNKENFIFDIKREELNNWYESNKKMLTQVEDTARYLKIHHIFEYLKYRENSKNSILYNKIYFLGNELFKTGVDVKRVANSTIKSQPEAESKFEDNQNVKNFKEATPPQYDPNNLSLELPLDITLIKKNAIKNFSNKGKFHAVLNHPNLNQLVDALISDSFWFVVCFFQISNTVDKKKVEELKRQVNEILKRISTNYFKFFINLCDDDCPIKKKDPVLNIFRDFMSQCVFYSLFLGFPKSRHIFNEEFRNRIISLFSYLYSGLNSQNNYTVNHWDLDLGKGNLIEYNNHIVQPKADSKDESTIKLPEISDFQKLIKSSLKNQEHIRGVRRQSESGKKMTVSTAILNTPLYRLYAENNRFETLNLIKPIKFSQRKVVDIENKTKLDTQYLEKVKDYTKEMAKKKKSYQDFITKNEKVFNEKLREVKTNTKRLKKEFQDIRVQRYQEYANYCIFISSK